MVKKCFCKLEDFQSLKWRMLFLIMSIIICFKVLYLKEKQDRSMRQQSLLVSKDNCKQEDSFSPSLRHIRNTAAGTHVTKHHSPKRGRLIRNK